MEWTVKDHVEAILKARKSAGKNQWYTYVSPCNRVKVKAFNTWAQIVRVDEFTESLPPDLTVTRFKAELEKTIGGLLKYAN